MAAGAPLKVLHSAPQEYHQESREVLKRQFEHSKSPPANLACGFQLLIVPNFRKRCGQQCRCALCQRQGVVVANDEPLTIDGLVNSGLTTKGDDVSVQLQYVVVHQPTGNMAHPTTLVLKQLDKLKMDNPSTFRTVVRANQLMATWSAACIAKKAVSGSIDSQSSRPIQGSFHTYLRAEVVCLGSDLARSFLAYSPELYVCGKRNLRRLQRAPVRVNPNQQMQQ